MPQPRRNPFRAEHSKHQEQRRNAFLTRSKQARADALQRARELATQVDTESDAEQASTGEAGDGDLGRSRKGTRVRRHYAGLLMSYEWMIEVPQTLGPAWRVMARPEGKRCLLIASNGRTTTRLKSGALLHMFPSALPNGSNKTRKQSHIFCMFDTIFHEADETYYIIDVLAWNGVHLCSSSFDCRSSWARCQFQHSQAAEEPYPGHRFRIRPCALHVCNEAGLREAYEGDTPYQRDGLILCHQDSPYVMEANPYALHWKDEHCSRWAVDTDAAGERLEQQEVVLAFQPDGTLLTGDRPQGVALGRLPTSVLDRFKEKMKAGLLLRFRIGAHGFYLGSDGDIAGADLQWVGVANQNRPAADLHSRTVFQWQMRHGKEVTMQALLAAAAANEHQPACAPLPISHAQLPDQDMTM